MTRIQLTVAAGLSLLLASAACASRQETSQAASHNVSITLEAARQTALARVPGQVQEEELEEEEGRWVYEFDIKPHDPAAPAKEVLVDANTGQIVLVEDD